MSLLILDFPRTGCAYVRLSRSETLMTEFSISDSKREVSIALDRADRALGDASEKAFVESLSLEDLPLCLDFVVDLARGEGAVRKFPKSSSDIVMNALSCLTFAEAVVIEILGTLDFCPVLNSV